MMSNPWPWLRNGATTTLADWRGFHLFDPAYIYMDTKCNHKLFSRPRVPKNSFCLQAYNSFLSCSSTGCKINLFICLVLVIELHVKQSLHKKKNTQMRIQYFDFDIKYIANARSFHLKAHFRAVVWEQLFEFHFRVAISIDLFMKNTTSLSIIYTEYKPPSLTTSHNHHITLSLHHITTSSRHHIITFFLIADLWCTDFHPALRPKRTQRSHPLITQETESILGDRFINSP